MGNKKKKPTDKRNKKITLISFAIATITVLGLIIGLSYGWFFYQAEISTLVTISEPSAITIGGPHGDSMTALDLSYTDDDKNTDGSVTIRRVLSVSSRDSQHKLEIVHTTNMKGLTFNLYSATEETGGGNISEGGYSYSYDSKKPISGSYLNNLEKNTDYKYANESQHSVNYAEDDSVQIHAEPLYWLVANALDATPKEETSKVTAEQEYLTYYVLEITWKETTKETDLFYVLAKGI